MTSQHLWFPSGNHTLLAHLNVPAQPVRHGVVIVPPFGWEDICAYRPLRSLAAGLASKGIATLRFDLPGTGDSSGSPLDRRLLAAWAQSVQNAVSELKKNTGLQKVSIFGVRMGALLALAAAPGSNVDGLILWGASATGRVLLRELRAFRNLEVSDYAEGEMPPPAPVEGLEVAGFLLSPETEKEIEVFNVDQLPPLPGQRVLLLSRDSFPHDKKLVQSLEKAGCQITLKTGAGYQDMLAAPHEPVEFSADTEREIVEFIDGSYAGNPLSDASRASSERNRSWSEGGLVETALTLSYNSRSIFSILARPSVPPASDWGLLFMNAGGVRHIGPNRMWVEAARRWATRGIPSMRFDFQPVGESDGDELATLDNLHDNSLVEQLDVVMSAMRKQMNCRRFIAVGLCSGAFASFQALLVDPSIRHALMLNPRVFFWDPEIESRRLAQRVNKGLGDVSYWRRLVCGEIEPQRIQQAARIALTRLLHGGVLNARIQQIPRHAMASSWDRIKRLQTRVTLVFADGEPLRQEMIDEKQLPPSNNPLIKSIHVGKTGHTFRALWAQQLVQDLIDSEVALTIQEEFSQCRPEEVLHGLPALV